MTLVMGFGVFLDGGGHRGLVRLLLVFSVGSGYCSTSVYTPVV